MVPSNLSSEALQGTLLHTQVQEPLTERKEGILLGCFLKKKSLKVWTLATP